MSPHPSVPLSAPVPARALERAVAHVRAGGLLILPTDTVYGIGALAADAAGVSRLLAAKGLKIRQGLVDNISRLVVGTIEFNIKAVSLSINGHIRKAFIVRN